MPTGRWRLPLAAGCAATAGGPLPLGCHPCALCCAGAAEEQELLGQQLCSVRVKVKANPIAAHGWRRRWRALGLGKGRRGVGAPPYPLSINGAFPLAALGASIFYCSFCADGNSEHDLCTPHPADEALYRRERTFLAKLNLVLVDILKQDWPHKWPSFIPDIIGARWVVGWVNILHAECPLLPSFVVSISPFCAALCLLCSPSHGSKTNETLCEDSMDILQLPKL